MQIKSGPLVDLALLSSKLHLVWIASVTTTSPIGVSYPKGKPLQLTEGRPGRGFSTLARKTLLAPDITDYADVPGKYVHADSCQRCLFPRHGVVIVGSDGGAGIDPRFTTGDDGDGRSGLRCHQRHGFRVIPSPGKRDSRRGFPRRC